jgi:hypothetical protein
MYGLRKNALPVSADEGGWSGGRQGHRDDAGGVQQDEYPDDYMGGRPRAAVQLILAAFQKIGYPPESRPTLRTHACVYIYICVYVYICG